jgi:hypothetical protein
MVPLYLRSLNEPAEVDSCFWDINRDNKWDFRGKYGDPFAFRADSSVLVRFEARTRASGALRGQFRVLVCPQNTIAFHRAEVLFCMDKYEYPNVEGKTPISNLNQNEAMDECGREKKTLCLAPDWEFACTAGEARRHYPYVGQYQGSVCNTRDLGRNSILTSGALPGCRTPEGVFDLSGNLQEWIQSSEGVGLRGGSWLSGENESNCRNQIISDPRLRLNPFGFRCCSYPFGG